MEKSGKKYNVLMAFIVFLLAAGVLLFYLRYEGREVETYVIPEKPDVVLSVDDAVDTIEPQILNTETEYNKKQTLVFKPGMPVSIVRIIYSQFPEAFLNAIISYVPYGKEDEAPIERMKYVQKGKKEILFAFPQVEFDELLVEVHDIEDVERIDLYREGAYVDVNKTVPRILNTCIAILLAALLGVVSFVSNAELRTGKRLGFPFLYLMLEIAVLRYCLQTRGYESYSQSIEIAIYVMLTIATIVLCMMYKMLFVWNTSLHKIFPLVGITMGVIMMLLIQPYTVPDEPVHYYQAYRVSNQLLGMPADSIRWEDLRFLENRSEAYSCWNCYGGYVSLAEWFHLTNESDEIKQLSSVEVNNAPLGYVVTGAAIAAARLMNLSGEALFYFGRLANLLAFVAAISVVIYWLPFGQTAVMCIAGAPVCMQFAASYSYDSVVTALAFLCAAYVLRLWEQKRQISMIQFAICCALGMILAPNKVVYTPITAMVFLISSEKYEFGGKNKRILNVAVVVLAFASLFIMQGREISGHMAEGIVEWSSDNPEYSVAYLLSNIRETVNIYLKDFEVNSDSYFDYLFTNKLGWHQLKVNHWLMCLFIVVFFVGCQKNEEDGNVVCTPCLRWVMLGVLISIVMLTQLTMLLAWTPMGTDYVLGVQGRYFIPAMIILIPIIRNSHIVVSSRVSRWCCLLTLLIDLYAVVNLLQNIPGVTTIV